MAKKLNIGKILYGVAALLGVVALIMLFVDNVNLTMKGFDGKEGLTGLEIAFGKTENDVKILKFSFLGLLPILFVVAGIVLSAIQAFAKNGNKIIDIVAVVCFVVAAVLYFIMPNLMVYSNAMETVAKMYTEKLAVGAIIAAICSIGSAAVVATKVILKK